MSRDLLQAAGLIESFRHKGLRALFEHDDSSGVDFQHVARLRDILARLQTDDPLGALSLPTYRLHKLKGGLAGRHAVTVRANWRVTFEIRARGVADVDYEDYH